MVGMKTAALPIYPFCVSTASESAREAAYDPREVGGGLLGGMRSRRVVAARGSAGSSDGGAGEGGEHGWRAERRGGRGSGVGENKGVPAGEAGRKAVDFGLDSNVSKSLATVRTCLNK